MVIHLYKIKNCVLKYFSCCLTIFRLRERCFTFVKGSVKYGYLGTCYTGSSD